MYDELVKRLRNCSTQAAPCKTCDMTEDGSCSDTLMKQAADAIEELSEDNTALNGTVTNLLEQIKELSKPRWIPVTERLPSDFVSVQAHMTDAGNFPPVREAYVVNGHWFFPALKEFHPVDMWRRFDEPPKEEA